MLREVGCETVSHVRLAVLRWDWWEGADPDAVEDMERICVYGTSDEFPPETIEAKEFERKVRAAEGGRSGGLDFASVLKSAPSAVAAHPEPADDVDEGGEAPTVCGGGDEIGVFMGDLVESGLLDEGDEIVAAVMGGSLPHVHGQADPDEEELFGFPDGDDVGIPAPPPLPRVLTEEENQALLVSLAIKLPTLEELKDLPTLPPCTELQGTGLYAVTKDGKVKLGTVNAVEGYLQGSCAHHRQRCPQLARPRRCQLFLRLLDCRFQECEKCLHYWLLCGYLMYGVCEYAEIPDGQFCPHRTDGNEWRTHILRAWGVGV